MWEKIQNSIAITKLMGNIYEFFGTLLKRKKASHSRRHTLFTSFKIDKAAAPANHRLPISHIMSNWGNHRAVTLLATVHCSLSLSINTVYLYCLPELLFYNVFHPVYQRCLNLFWIEMRPDPRIILYPFSSAEFNYGSIFQSRHLMYMFLLPCQPELAMTPVGETQRKHPRYVTTSEVPDQGRSFRIAKVI